MQAWLGDEGFRIHRGVFTPDELTELRREVERVVLTVGARNVRHLRTHSERLDRLAHSPALLRELPDDLAPVRSLLFDKPADGNWPVAWHRDMTLALREQRDVEGYGPWSLKAGVPHARGPRRLLERMATVRIHLDDTPADNGALRVLPKSHLDADLLAEPTPRDDGVVCACSAGDVLVLSPLLLHASSRSEHPDHRRVIHFEYAPRDSLAGELDWFEAP